VGHGEPAVTILPARLVVDRARETFLLVVRVALRVGGIGGEKREGENGGDDRRANVARRRPPSGDPCMAVSCWYMRRRSGDRGPFNAPLAERLRAA
jgi:hypothetical protein